MDPHPPSPFGRLGQGERRLQSTGKGQNLEPTPLALKRGKMDNEKKSDDGDGNKEQNLESESTYLNQVTSICVFLNLPTGTHATTLSECDLGSRRNAAAICSRTWLENQYLSEKNAAEYILINAGNK